MQMSLIYCFLHYIHAPPLQEVVNQKLTYLERISFKLSLLVYKAIHGLAPCYLNEICIPVSTVPNLSALRSAARRDLVVLRTRLELGNRAFCVAGPVAWNSLPLDSGHSFGTYIINVQKHAQDTSVLSFLLHWLTVSRVRAANIVRRPCSDSNQNRYLTDRHRHHSVNTALVVIRIDNCVRIFFADSCRRW